jgi:hypothetical protein
MTNYLNGDLADASEIHGERKHLIDFLFEQVEIGQKKRVAASLRPPFAFGFFSPELAPRANRPNPWFIINVYRD